MPPRPLLLCSLVSFLAACSSMQPPDIGESGTAGARDLFASHADFENQGPLERALFGDREAERKQTEERIARLEQQLQQAQNGRTGPDDHPAAAQPTQGTYATKLGVTAAGSVPRLVADALDRALAAAERTQPLVAVSAAELSQQMSAYGCSEAALAACADRLATYPGLHFVAVVSDIAKAGDDRATATVRLHDLAHGAALPAVTVELAARNGQPTAAGLQSLADRIAADALTAARATPWSTRAFDRQGKEIFLAAGARSGLEAGTLLAVHGGGRVVRSPTGSVAGWLPGPKKGTLRVTHTFGDDYAVAELVEGQPPGPADRVLAASAEE